jgi:hypothetical protein
MELCAQQSEQCAALLKTIRHLKESMFQKLFSHSWAALNSCLTIKFLSKSSSKPRKMSVSAKSKNQRAKLETKKKLLQRKSRKKKKNKNDYK